MQNIDIVNVKYMLSHVAHEFDSQTFIADVEEHYSGEFYNINFQRGYSTYTLEVEGERLARWLAADETSPDMIDMVDSVKLAVEELTN